MNIVEKKKYIFNCKKCGNVYSLILSNTEYTKSKYKKNCSLKCANSRIQTNEINKKRSNTLFNKAECIKEIRYCKECGTSFETRIKRNQIFCNHKCSSTYNSREYVKRTNLKKDEYEIYRKECKFKFNIYEYPNYFDLILIEKFGWYAAFNRGNNLNGISRDHKISVLYGWNNNIDASIISHPANCELIRHKKNQRKNRKCSITLDELKKEITKWISARVV